jgi:hypothetical protein
MKFHPKYCSYITPLVRALMRVEGDVLEMGTGVVSTHFLHWMCLDQGRRLVSYENNPYYYKLAKLCEADFHEVHFVEDWDDADIERPWGIALIDHAPAIRRKEDIRRLAPYAQVIVYHDSQGRSNKHYHYEEIHPLFRYRMGYGKALPQSTTVSNFVDVGAWA